MRIRLPAAAGTLAAFSANGLFAGLSGLFLATTLHHPSHALAGVALELGASAPDTVLGFAVLVGLGVTVSGWALLGRRVPQART